MTSFASRRTLRFRWQPVWLVLGLMGASAAHALDLVDSWHLARAHDPQIAAAQAQREQTLERRSQIDALWDPQARASFATGLGGQNSRITNAQAMGQTGVAFDTSVNAGLLARVGVGVQKPLLNQGLQSQSQLLDLSARMGDVQWAQAEQELAWRVVQRYVDVLGARQSLAIWQRQQETLQKVQAEIQRRRAVGDASLMDVQEAQARVALVRAQVLQAQHELDTQSLAFKQLTGQAPQTLQGLSEQAPLTVIPTMANAEWLRQARERSTALQLVDLQIRLQEEEARRIRVSGTTPTLDGLAQVHMERLAGQGMMGSASQQAAQYLVGVQWSAPLGAQGLTQAREREALKQVAKLQRDRDVAESNVEFNVTQAWQAMQSVADRLQALAEAHRISQQRLRTTREAHRTGSRSTLEWLGAEQDAAQAELAWRQMRLQVLMSRARLFWASGLLGEAQLQELNRVLQ